MMASYTHQNDSCNTQRAELNLPSPDGQEDPETLLNAWLGELDTLTAVSDYCSQLNYIILLVRKPQHVEITDLQ